MGDEAGRLLLVASKARIIKVPVVRCQDDGSFFAHLSMCWTWYSLEVMAKEVRRDWLVPRNLDQCEGLSSSLTSSVSLLEPPPTPLLSEHSDSWLSVLRAAVSSSV